jgi:hypothetical protein
MPKFGALINSNLVPSDAYAWLVIKKPCVVPCYGSCMFDTFSCGELRLARRLGIIFDISLCVWRATSGPYIECYVTYDAWIMMSYDWPIWWVPYVV